MTGKTILIVEDEGIIAAEMKLSLTRKGLEEVYTANTKEKALKLFHEVKPNVVLMDIMLRGKLDGVELAKEMNSHENIALIYITGNTDFINADDRVETQPKGILNKPYNLNTLVKLINT